MKRNLLFCFLAVFLFSCSNDEFDNSLSFESQSNPMSGLATDSVVVIGNFADWFGLFGVEPDTLNPDLKAPNPRLRSDLSPTTAAGYNSITNTSKYRTMFNADMAKQLGLYPDRIYHCYMKHVKKEIAIPSGSSFFENDSPACGYQPVYGSTETNFQKRGYSMPSTSSNAKTITLTTHVFYVEADEWGTSIKRDYPCSPTQVQWSYYLW